MKRTIVAILALSPAVLFAQAKSPAQPSSTPVLQSSIIRPVAVSAATPMASPAVTTTPIRISTGVTPPQLISSTNIEMSSVVAAMHIAKGSTVVLQMTVDETGKPTKVAVEKSVYQPLDAQVVNAVSQFRYKPAMLDGAAVASPVTLSVTIE